MAPQATIDRPFVVRYTDTNGERTRATFDTRAAAQAFRKATPGAGSVELPEVPVYNSPGIYRRGDRFVVRYTKGNGAKSKHSCATLTEARNFQATTKHAVKAGTFIAPKDRKVTFEAWATDWAKNLGGAKSTRRRWQGVTRNHLLDTFGPHLLGNIRVSHIRGWLAAQEDLGLARNTRRLHCEVLASCLKAAVDDGLLPSSPMDSIKRPKAQRAVERILTDEQVEAMAAALPARWRLIVWLGAMAGLRIGETMGLTFDRVDFAGERLRIFQSLDADGEFGDTKGRKARWVPVDRHLLDLIEAHVTEFGLATGGTLFHSERMANAPSMSSFYNNVWAPAIKPLGLADDIDSPHALRHFYATTALNNGVNIKAVSLYLGHASASFTLDKYVHHMPSNDDAVRSVFAGRFGRKLKAVA